MTHKFNSWIHDLSVCKNHCRYRVSHCKLYKVIVLCWGYRLWVCWYFGSYVFIRETFMPNSSVLFFWCCAPSRRWWNSKYLFCIISLNVQNVRPLSIFFLSFLAFYAFLVGLTASPLHIKWFPLHQEPKLPQWPQQLQQPQWLKVILNQFTLPF